MCLVLFSYQPGSQWPLVVAANRDEFYARPAAGAHRWEDAPAIFAGRDLEAGGTWLGITSTGRFATVTNFAEEAPDGLEKRSRGELVERFLNSDIPAHEYAHQIRGPDYRGFNLLVYDGHRLAYTSNRGFTEDLQPGVYGLANAELGATWPKVVSGTRALEAEREPSVDALIELLRDDSQPPDDELPKRGRPLELERRVAPRFIRGEEYGTRACTAVIFESSGTRQVIHFTEQLFLAGGVPGERTGTSIAIDACR